MNSRFGFNGKQNDNEIAGIGNWQDYGLRQYNVRIARFIGKDPLTAKYPMLTPYQFASNRPIDGVDLDGKEYFNCTTITSVSVNIAGGLGVGGHAGLYRGTAYDMVGKTYFKAFSDVHPSNQQLQDGSSNPQTVTGAEAGGSANIQFVHKPLFIDAFNALTLSLPLGADVKVGVGGGISIGEGTFGLSGEIGVGATIKTGNQTVLSQSFSVTYKAIDKIQSALTTDAGTFRVNGAASTTDANGNVTGWTGTLEVYGYDKSYKAGWKSTGVTMRSGNTTTTDNKNQPNGIWQSQDYQKEAAAKSN